MKIQSSNIENESKNDKNDNRPNKPPKGKRELPKWAIPVGIVALIVGFVFMVFLPKSGNDKKPNTSHSSISKSTSASKPQISSSSTLEDSNASESSKSSTEPSKSAEQSTTKPAVDMKPAITEFFTAFQEYSTDKDSPKSRADSMRKVATPDTVSSLIPNTSEGGDERESIAATYKFTKPIEIVADSNVSGNYAIVLSYSVKVMENMTHYTDTYVVGTEGDKITSVSKRSSVMDN